MPRVSIVGCGWLGLPLARRLVAEGHTVLGSTTSPDKLPLLEREGVQAHRFVLTDEQTWDSLGALLNADILILNIPPGFRRGDGQANLDAYRRLAPLVAQSNIQHVLFVSSTGAYPSTPGTYAETSTLESGGLAEMEAVWAAPQHTILRLAGLFGPGRTILRMLSGKERPDPQAAVNFIHLDDAVGLCRAILSQAAWGETLIGCAPAHPTKEAFYARLSEELGQPAPLWTSQETEGQRIIDGQATARKLVYTYQHPDPLAFPIN